MIANVSQPEVARPSAEGAIDFEDLIARCQTGCIESRNRMATIIQPEIYELAGRMSSQQSFARSLHALYGRGR